MASFFFSFFFLIDLFIFFEYVEFDGSEVGSLILFRAVDMELPTTRANIFHFMEGRANFVHVYTIE